MALIVISIFSFIACISCAIHNALTSSSEGQLISYWSRLLVALLSSWSSLSWWSFVGQWLLLHSSYPICHSDCLAPDHFVAPTIVPTHGFAEWAIQLLWWGFALAFLMRWVSSRSLGWWWPLIVLGPYNSLSLKRQYDLSLVPTDGTNWWCIKIVSELIAHICANGCTWRTKEKNQLESTSGVLAKDPSQVKSMIEESPRTQ